MKIKLPTSWDAVTLGEWQAIRKLLKSEADPYLVECAIISTLSGADMNDIQSLTREGHGKCMQALAFLKTPDRRQATQAREDRQGHVSHRDGRKEDHGRAVH
jgi:hypothetical protein